MNLFQLQRFSRNDERKKQEKFRRRGWTISFLIGKILGIHSLPLDNSRNSTWEGVLPLFKLTACCAGNLHIGKHSESGGVTAISHHRNPLHKMTTCFLSERFEGSPSDHWTKPASPSSVTTSSFLWEYKKYVSIWKCYQGGKHPPCARTRCSPFKYALSHKKAPFCSKESTPLEKCPRCLERLGLF